MKLPAILLFCAVSFALDLLPALRAATDAPAPEVAALFKRLQTGQNQTVVVYGTSLTQYGYWVTALKTWFDSRYPGKVTLVNSGGAGQNSDWGVHSVQEKVVANHPDLVFIEFTYNDCVTRFNLTPAHAKENLDKIVRAIQAQNPQVAVVLQTMNVPWDAPKGFTDSASKRPQLDAFNEVYRAYAREHHLTLLDHYPAWVHFRDTEPDKFHADVPDGTHPDKNGTLAVTWPGIENFLDTASASK